MPAVSQNFVGSGPVVNSLELRPHVLVHHPLGQALVQVLPLCVDGQFLQQVGTPWNIVIICAFSARREQGLRQFGIQISIQERPIKERVGKPTNCYFRANYSYNKKERGF